MPLERPVASNRPSGLKAGTVCEDLISTIDISAAILSLAGCQLPSYLQGRNFLDPKADKREAIYAARDKMDDTHDAMRAVRTKEFKYILNLMPERPWCQYNAYKEKQYPVLALMNVMHLTGKLNPVQDRFMQPSKPKEELYDLRNDPHETVNLAGDPKYANNLEEMRKLLAIWRTEIGDTPVTEAFRNGGWPADYPTRSLDEWEQILNGWKKHLLEGEKRPAVRPLYPNSRKKS